MTTTFAGRVPAFRQIGTVFTEDLNTRQMLREAKLDMWDVEKIKLDNIVNGYSVKDNLWATVRNDTNHVLGVVRDRYEVMQNEDAFAFADGILDGGGTWDTAGSFNDGTKVFGSMLIDKASIAIDPNGLNDKVDTFLLVSTSHDGSIPLQASITPIRVICQNTLNLALQKAGRSATPQTFKVRHTVTAQARADVAREALGLTFKYADEFSQMANKMYQTEITDNQFDQMIKNLYPKPDAPVEGKGSGAFTRWDNTYNLLWELRDAPTNRDIKNTAWGALNTLTERLDWFRQGEDSDQKALAASGFSANVNAEKQRILSTVLAVSS
jgi:phage/plasmid-like protein (TIGR03299 family)